MTSTNTTDLEDVDVFDFSLDALDTFDTLNTLDTLDTNTTSTITERRAYDDFTALDDIVLSSLHSLHFVLSPTTTILRVSTNCLSVLGCEPNLLLGQRLASLIHHDDARVFNSEIHDALRSPPSLPFRFHCRIRSVVAADRTHSAFELLGHYQVTPPGTLSPLQLMMPPPGIFSITARPAVTQRGHELDGMLELKVEQIRLTRRIEELQKQQVAEIGEEEASLREDDEAAVTARARTPRVGGTDAPPSSKRSRSSPPRLLADNPHPGPEGSGSPSKVEMGDAGIPFLARSRDSYSSLKSTDTERLSKRKFAVRDYRCARCGRTDSPEWRRGPDGPKTLCNACGLMYSKAKRRAEKQEQSESSKSEGREDREEEGIPMGYPPP